MNSPFSIFFRDLRIRMGLRQHELAEQLGYEQAYISAVELGKKNPSDELLRKLSKELDLSDSEQEALDLAVSESRRKFVLPKEVPTDTYRLCSELWAKIERLHPAQIRIIREAIRLDDEIVERPRYQDRQIRRCAKEREEAEM
jgi:transcriptional regulator with XRE-family HTH domain